MKKTALATAIATSLIVTMPAHAGVAEELEALKQRIAQLEEQLAEQKVQIAEQKSESNTAGGFAENVSVSGALELLATHSETDGVDGSEGDIEVDTFEIAIEAEINEKVSIATLVEYNADDGDIELSEAFAEIDAGAATVTAGLAPIPVAAINDAGWTSPLTDDYFDITEGMAMASFGNDAVSADIYAFNNDDGNSINSLGLSVAFEPADGISLGAGYVSDLSDADFAGLTVEADDAWRLNALAEVGPVALSAEYLEVNGQTTDPTFLALNAAFGAEVATFYVGYSEVDDAATDLERTVVGLEREFGENATISAEYVLDEEDGTDTDTVNLVLVTEF